MQGFVQFSPDGRTWACLLRGSTAAGAGTGRINKNYSLGRNTPYLSEFLEPADIGDVNVDCLLPHRRYIVKTNSEMESKYRMPMLIINNVVKEIIVRRTPNSGI